MSCNKLNVNLSNIKENFEYMKSFGKEKEYYAVVKADAYGLGAVRVSKALEDICDGFCVGIVDEAVELRKSGIKKKILVLGYEYNREFEDILKYDISIPIYTLDQAKDINEYSKEHNSVVNIHIKVDTGHGRLGFRINEESFEDVFEISKLSNVHIEGIFSHFSDAPNLLDPSYTYEQKEKFDFFIENLEKRNINVGLKHIRNDAALVNFDFNYDMARLGICIYGEYPDPSMKEKLSGLKKTFTWTSILTNTKYIEKGESVSYSRSFIADKKTRIGTVTIGYGDGYKRASYKEGYVLINGKRAPIRGVVNMDQMMVDISDIDCEIGDAVILIGKSEEEVIECDKLAKWNDTISYEIMTSISKRVKRVYI